MALSAVLIITGCSAGGSGGSSDQKITLRFAWWGSDQLNAIKAKQIKLFEKKYPNVTVKGEPSDYAPYYPKLATQVAGGNAPDAIQITYDSTPSYAQKGALLDLSKYIDTKKYPAGSLDAGKVDGALDAIPTGIGARAIVINTAVFKAAGVPIPDDKTWTWDDYVKIAAQITKNSPAGTYGSVQPVNDQFLQAIARQEGSDLFTAKGKLAVSESIVQKMFEISKNLQDTGGAPSASVSTQDNGAALEQSLMGTGKVAMAYVPINFIGIYAQSSGDDMRILRLPGDTSTRVGEYLQPTVQYAVYGKTKHPKEAAELIDFLLNSSAAGPLNQLTLGIPAVPSVQKAVTKNLTPSDQAQVDFVNSLSGHTGKAPNPLALPAINTQNVLNPIASDVLFGKQTPAQAAASFISQEKAAIAANQ
ncbi:ABC transporter substrate-binding protein [Pseudolysinimonas sp.]|uniref:ABC transporter substrate-binding protein n=1 Tax=Pseudolysinimonas sp. TaxID=2680009 RepID=UPI003F80609F